MEKNFFYQYMLPDIEDSDLQPDLMTDKKKQKKRTMIIMFESRGSSSL